MKRALIFSLLGAIGISSTVVAIGYPTISHQGEQAVARMSHDERALLRKLQLIKKGMSHSEVSAILGEPDREAFGLRPTWRVDGNPLNQIAVYFDANGVRHIRWLSIGNFLYEPLQ